MLSRAECITPTTVNGMHGKSSIAQDCGGQKKEAAVSAVSSPAVSYKNTGTQFLCSPGPFARLGEDTPPIKCIIYDLAHCRSVWIDIHTVAGTQMSKNAFSGDVQSCSHQLGIASRLYMVDPQ